MPGRSRTRAISGSSAATGSFKRMVPLPCAVVPEGAKASLENGVLTVIMRKLRPSRGREVRVRIRKSEE